MSYINTFGGNTVQSANTSYIQYDISAESIVLSWPASFQDTPEVVYSFMNILSTNPGRSITLPAANLSSVGSSFKFINNGGQAIDIKNNTGSTIVTVNSGQAWELYLRVNTTVAGTWGFIPAGNGTSGVVSFTSVQPAAGLTVNQNFTTGAITQTFALANDLLALENLGGVGGTGYAARIADNTWALRSITSGNANIAITNPAGVAGNTSITLNPTLTGMVAINVGNLSLYTNTIEAVNGNNISLLPSVGGVVSAAGPVSLLDNGVVLPALRFYNPGNTNYIGFQAPPGAFAYNLLYRLPSVAPTLTGQVLSTTVPGGGLSTLSWTTLPVVQIVTTSSTAAQNAATVILLDDTTPQIGEGTLLITTTITPQYTGPLVIEFTATLANTSVAANIIIALFQDATLNALTAGAFWCPAAGSGTPLNLRYILPAAVAGVATTFTIRYGISTAGSVYILTGNSGTGTLGGVPQMSISVTELSS